MNAPLDQYALEQATIRARLLSATAGIPSQEIDDLRQELLLDLFRRSSRFDSERGQWRGFVNGVLRHKAGVLATSRYRRTSHEVFVADLARAGSEDTEAMTFDTLDWQDPTEGLEVSIDARRVLGQLPPDLQYLARLLTEFSVQEVGFAIGKSRSRVYQMVRQLRDAFYRAGFRVVRPRGSRR
jgi:DNA-directed RNA polymerase specialized sigma24 family protein